MMCSVEFNYDKKKTILRYPKKAFIKANGEECLKRIQEKFDGVMVRVNSRYIYIELPFNLMTMGKENET